MTDIARVVDQDIDHETGFVEFDQTGGDARIVGRVHAQRAHAPAAAAAAAAESGNRFIEFRLPTATNRHRVPRIEQQPGGRETDPLAAAGDQRVSHRTTCSRLPLASER